MIVPKSYKCDNCEQPHGQTNGWFVVDQGGSSVLSIYTWDHAVSIGYLDRDGMKHACGQSCVHKIVDQFFTKDKEYVSNYLPPL